jgi:hypothetical protein
MRNELKANYPTCAQVLEDYNRPNSLVWFNRRQTQDENRLR